MVLGEVDLRYVGAGVVARHGWPVVGDGEQDRPSRITDIEIETVDGQQLVKALINECLIEHHANLVEVSSGDTSVAIQ